MKQSTLFLHTLREPPGDAEVASHKLLAQAGFIYKFAAGIYAYTPAMWRVLQKISNIVREELDKAGAQEVMLPILQPRQIWDDSGRWDRYVQEQILFHFNDRKDAEVCLGPTHEEVITLLVKAFASSYKHVPLNLYQIQTKFRDEIRPRFGLMRGREFIMKDGYSFDVSQESLDQTYEKMDQAYRSIFSRCGLDFISVEADSGSIGGSGSHEFVVSAETGEDVFLFCDETGYAANQERAESILPELDDKGGEPEELKPIPTPNASTIEEVAGFLKLPVSRVMKALIYKAELEDESQFVMALIRGDQGVNEIKLKNLLGAFAVELASEKDVEAISGCPVGFSGPIKPNQEIRIIADESLKGMSNLICGGNKKHVHYENVNIGRDFPEPEFVDIRLAQGGDLAPGESGHKLTATRGIEVGHIFKLGTKYSESLGATVTGEDGRPVPLVMGCYGIGVSRVAAAAIEQNHDEGGIIWPLPIAPWSVHLICLNPKKEEQSKLADSLYQELQDSGIEVLYDDRKVSPGIKFADSDLVGVPLRVVVGRDAPESVEFVKRDNVSDKQKIDASQIIEHVKSFL